MPFAINYTIYTIYGGVCGWWLVISAANIQHLKMKVWGGYVADVDGGSAGMT